MQAEEEFGSRQNFRREKQLELTSVQTNLRGISSQLDKVHRGEEQYIVLLTEEHKILKEENLISQEVMLSVKYEYCFVLICTDISYSHCYDYVSSGARV